MRLHRCYVGIFHRLTTDTRSISQTNKVEVVTEIDISAGIDTVVQEAEVDTEVELVFLLVSQL